MAFVDFLEPTGVPRQSPSQAPYSPVGGAFHSRLSYKGSGSGSGTLTPSNDVGSSRFDLRRAMVARSESKGASPETAKPPQGPGSPEINVCFADRRRSFSITGANNGGTSNAGSPGKVGLGLRNLIPSDPRRMSGSPNNSSPNSPRSSAASPALPYKPGKGLEMRLQSTFERSMNGTFRSGAPSTNDTSSSNGSDSATGGSELFAASAAEDLANDAALGAFLAATNKNRRQRAAEEMMPRSQQLLNQQATRRARRMSTDGAVCETRPWVDALQGTDVRAKRDAAKGIRMALKDGPENRMRIVGSGGVRPLVLTLKCPDGETAEHAAAAILFLCMSRDTASEVVCSGGVRALIDAVGIEDPLREAARSNAAASLFALSQKDDNRKLIHAQGAVKPLVALLKSAKTTRAKKDACLALFNMALVPQVPEELVQLEVIERTVELLEEAEEGVEEKAAALLGTLTKSMAGLKRIHDEEDALYALADTLEGGSTAAAEHACVALHHLAAAHPKVVPKILAEGCLPPLVRLACQSKKGSDSRLLLEILRAHCKRKAKEEEEQRRRDAGTRQPSRLGTSASFSDGPGRPSLVDRESLLKQWSGETAPAVM